MRIISGAGEFCRTETWVMLGQPLVAAVKAWKSACTPCERMRFCCKKSCSSVPKPPCTARVREPEGVEGGGKTSQHCHV